MSGPSFLPPVPLPAFYAPSQFVPLPLIQYNTNLEGHEQRFSFVPDTFALFPCYFPQPTSSIDTSLMLASIPQPRLASEVAPPQPEEEDAPSSERKELPSQPRRKKTSHKKVDEDPDYRPASHNKRRSDKAELEEQKYEQPAAKKPAEEPPIIAVQRQPNVRRINIYQYLKNKILLKSPFVKNSAYEKHIVKNNLLDDLSTDQIFELASLYVMINAIDSDSKSFLSFLYRNNVLQKLSPDQIKQLMQESGYLTKYVFTEILLDSEYFKNFSITEQIEILHESSTFSIFDEIYAYYINLNDYFISIKSSIRSNNLNHIIDKLNHPLFNKLSANDLINLILFSRENHNNLIAQFMILHKRFKDYQIPDNIKCFFKFIKDKSGINTSTIESFRTDLHISDQDLLEIITRMMS